MLLLDSLVGVRFGDASCMIAVKESIAAIDGKSKGLLQGEVGFLKNLGSGYGSFSGGEDETRPI